MIPIKPSVSKLALKISLFVLGLSTLSPLTAASECAFNGFYVGVMGGFLQSEAKISSTSSAQYQLYLYNPGEITLEQRKANVYRHHGIGAITFGKGQQIGKCAFLAGEIFLSFASRNTSVECFGSDSLTEFVPQQSHYDSLRTKTSASMNPVEVAIDVRPGFIVDSNTLLYGRIGLGFTKVNSKNSVDFGFRTTEGQSLTNLSKKKERGSAACRLGIGAERKINSNWSMTADYIFSHYGKVKTNNVGDSAFANGEDGVIVNGFTSSSSAKQYSQSCMIGIKYYLNKN